MVIRQGFVGICLVLAWAFVPVSGRGLGGEGFAQTAHQPAAAAPDRWLKIPEFWQTVEKATSQTLKGRRRFAATLHNLLSTTPENQAAERAHIFAALGVLHASDPLFMHASLSFLAAAQKTWPEFNKSNEAVYVWTKLLGYMRRKQVVNEHLLSRVAVLFASGQVASSEIDEFPYYYGWSLFRSAQYSDALASLARVPLGSPHYRRAKFLEGTSQMMLGRTADARETFQVVVSLDPTAAEAQIGLPARSVQRLRDLSMVNIARILYEQQQFKESLAYYRAINQDSYYFYESLSEQAWPFFMAGYPARAMGAAYAATSPFFADRFNPDVYFLNATLYYWICQYGYARQALAQFIEHTKDEGDSLRIAMSGLQKMTPRQRRDRMLGILQALEQGLNPRSFGLGPKTMAFLSGQEGLIDSYRGYAALQERRLRVQDLALPKAIHSRVQLAIEEFEEDLGRQVALHAEDSLSGLLEDYESGLVQARLLWLEILTAEKDKVLGQERSVQSSQFVGDEKSFLDAVAFGVQKSWIQDKNEFWYDELGSYVFTLPSQCSESSKVGVSQ
jgi:tetratricopeptide (TPR) repeat protein